MRWLTYLLLAALAACAAPQQLTVSTVPQGALLTEDGTGNQYLAPVTLHYKFTEEMRDIYSCFQAHAFTAQWVSGAEARTQDPIRLCGTRGAWEVIIRRPASAPGLDQDIRAARERLQQIESARLTAEIERLRSQQEAAKGWEDFGYGLACAIGDGNCSDSDSRPSHSRSYRDYSLGSSEEDEEGCRSDFDCGFHEFCAKPYLSYTGICRKKVDQFDIDLPRVDSIMPNLDSTAQCTSDLDCGIGSKCDRQAKVCFRP